ncbi:hypothetical protein ABXS69_04690 [Actinomyces timonensis]|uniref:Uncharacterized protein n=1 Tax=Actinomyces timonensis TaxID=1288391 RepID=A0AAU8N421_9ACTO
MSLLSKILADIRTVIAAVLGIFGLFLLVCSGFLNGEEAMAKTGGVNANLWAGIALIVVAVLMALWWATSPGDPDEGSSGSPSDPGAQRQG